MHTNRVKWIIIAIVFFSVQSVAAATLQSNHLIYRGAFRVPYSGGEELSYGGSVITYNPVNNSLFIVGNIGQQQVGEISIPTPVLTTNTSLMPRATMLQSMTDITEGNREKIGPGGSNGGDDNAVLLGGLMVWGNKLIGTSYAYYSELPVLSHFTSSLDLAATSDFAGMYAVGQSPEAPTASYVSGWMCPTPTAWQSALGGPAITGNGSLSILGRTSFGPAAFSFNPDQLGAITPVPANALLYYTEDHPLDTYGSSNSRFWNDTTKMAGMVAVDGTDTILYFGYHGIGDRTYGNPVTNPIYADECAAPDSCYLNQGLSLCSDVVNCTTGRKGLPNDPGCIAVQGADAVCFYDPSGMGAKGPHAYPYLYQVWAYNLNDLAAVHAGSKQPWEVMPYAIWELPFAVAPTDVFGGAAAYDKTNKKLYISQPQGEQVGCCTSQPVIHVFDIDMAASSPSSITVGGRAMLLNGSVTLRNNGGDDLVITANDRRTLQTFAFNTQIPVNSNYNITIIQQPNGQTCKLLYGSGTAEGNANVSNVVLSCSGAGSNVSDTTAPTVTAFTLPATSSSLTVPVTAFTATDGTGVTGYCVAGSGNSSGCTWTSTSPTDLAYATAGSHTAYPFAKDAAGNIGSGTPQTVVITLPLVPGSCGASNGLALSSAPTVNLCTASTPSAVSGTGPWSWTCAGSGGGSTANCSASLASSPSRSISVKFGSGGKITGNLK